MGFRAYRVYRRRLLRSPLLGTLTGFKVMGFRAYRAYGVLGLIGFIEGDCFVGPF